VAVSVGDVHVVPKLRFVLYASIGAEVSRPECDWIDQPQSPGGFVIAAETAPPPQL
jgi:hypothetical protein